jgi:hypothetical protein
MEAIVREVETDVVSTLDRALLRVGTIEIEANIRMAPASFSTLSNVSR